jgi:hypothetical protein
VLGLVSIGSTQASSIKYRRLLSRTIRAAAVPEASSSADIGDGTGGTATAAQGGLKPESDLLFESATAEVSTFAHLIPMTRNEMDDAEGLASVVDSEMRIGVERVPRSQLIQGDRHQRRAAGRAPHAGHRVVHAGHRAERRRAEGRRDPPALHAAQDRRVLPDGAADPPERLAGGSPVRRTPTATTSTGRRRRSAPSRCGASRSSSRSRCPRASRSVAEWSRLLYLVRSGLQTFVSDSHKDWFARNLLALLAEARGMSIIRRPQAFGEVDYA